MTAQELAPKLWRIPIPLPAIPGAEHLGFCNAYLVGGEPWLLIDTGMHTDEAWRALEAGLREAGVAWEALEVVLVTHHHPDHYGMSRPIRERSGARVMLHRRDVEMMYESMWGGQTMAGFIAEHGGPRLEGAPPMLGTPEFKPAAPDAYVEDEQVFDLGTRRLRAIHTPGHSPGHTCFAIGEEGIVLTGDHILPKITPHVGFFPGGDPNPLGSFLDSLKRIGEGGYRVALPAHGEPFLDPASHVARIVAHHEYRLRATVAALGREARTAWDVVPAIFGDDLPGFHRFAAFFETLSHLVLAEHEGLVERIGDDAGVVRWRRRTPPAPGW
jgi:glyoxylase-like metal-dependent hydrolase (beta-lactamase superfamily II)